MWISSETHGEGVGAGVGNGLGNGLRVALATGVEAGDADDDAGGATGVGEGAAAEAVAELAVGAGEKEPDGVEVPAHAARRTPRRRDAAWRFAFICRRRWCCELSRR